MYCIGITFKSDYAFDIFYPLLRAGYLGTS